MKKINIFLALTIIFTAILSCEKSDPINGKKNGINTVTQFVYDGMSAFYLWDYEISNKKPTKNDNNPEEYFYKILNSTDTEHGWSWITDDVNSLMAEFGGESTDAFGFQPFALYTDESYTTVVGFIRYVYPNTPAEAAGLKRGEVIIRIDGQTITENNYIKMYGSNSPTRFTVLDKNLQNQRDVTITPATISTDPVLFTKVFDEYTGHKIGYLFYTNFIANYNQSLYNTFSEFKSAGITDLVIDLRYNPGGGVSAATYLASLIAPVINVQNKDVLTIMNYNSFVNSNYDSKNRDRKTYLGSNDTKYSNPVNANINLDKVYIITTGSSASASELLTFCLEPYMQVEQIGEKTSGKYTASWTIHAYDNFIKNGNARAQPVYPESDLSTKEKAELKNWAMQPIVGRYTDKNNKDFIATNGLIPDHPVATQEYNTKTWLPIGDTNDYLLAKAVSLITGQPIPSVAAESHTRSLQLPQFKESGLTSQFEKIVSESVIIDNPKLLPPIVKSN